MANSAKSVVGRIVLLDMQCKGMHSHPHTMFAHRINSVALFCLNLSNPMSVTQSNRTGQEWRQKDRPNYKLTISSPKLVLPLAVAALQNVNRWWRRAKICKLAWHKKHSSSLFWCQGAKVVTSRFAPSHTRPFSSVAEGQ